MNDFEWAEEIPSFQLPLTKERLKDVVGWSFIWYTPEGHYSRDDRNEIREWKITNVTEEVNYQGSEMSNSIRVNSFLYYINNGVYILVDKENNTYDGIVLNRLEEDGTT